MKLRNLDKLRIVYFPAPILNEVAEPVESFDDDLAALAERMLVLMHEGEGIGLAAPQVGLGIRLFVCNPTAEPDKDTVVVNPRVVEMSGGEEGQEGCLSLPGVTVNVRRATSVTMEARDLGGRRVRLRGDQIVARVWQHEADHLEGKLILDYMSPSDEIANRRAIKQLKDDYESSRRK